MNPPVISWYMGPKGNTREPPRNINKKRMEKVSEFKSIGLIVVSPVEVIADTAKKNPSKYETLFVVEISAPPINEKNRIYSV